MRSVTILATTPPALGMDNFVASYADTLYVPKGCLAAYKSNSAWSSAFTAIVEQP